MFSSFRTGKNRVRQPSPPAAATVPPHLAGYQNHSGLLLPAFKGNVMYLPSQTALPPLLRDDQLNRSRDNLDQSREQLSRSRDNLRDAPRAQQPAPKRVVNRELSKSNGTLFEANSSEAKSPAPPPPPTCPPPPPPPPHYEDEALTPDDSASNNMYFEIAESRVIIKETRRDDVPPLELWRD